MFFPHRQLMFNFNFQQTFLQSFGKFFVHFFSTTSLDWHLPNIGRGKWDSVGGKSQTDPCAFCVPVSVFALPPGVPLPGLSLWLRAATVLLTHDTGPSHGSQTQRLSTVTASAYFWAVLFSKRWKVPPEAPHNPRKHQGVAEQQASLHVCCSANGGQTTFSNAPACSFSFGTLWYLKKSWTRHLFNTKKNIKYLFRCCLRFLSL